MEKSSDIFEASIKQRSKDERQFRSSSLNPVLFCIRSRYINAMTRHSYSSWHFSKIVRMNAWISCFVACWKQWDTSTRMSYVNTDLKSFLSAWDICECTIPAMESIISLKNIVDLEAWTGSIERDGLEWIEPGKVQGSKVGWAKHDWCSVNITTLGVSLTQGNVVGWVSSV